MIKFRAWDNEAEVYTHNEYYFEVLPDGKELELVSAIDFGDTDRLIIEQFTGLKDVNGKEIYEGDILHFGSIWCVGDEYDPREEYHIGTVEYRPDYASYVVNCNGRIYPLEAVISFESYSVQGNIHANPELLEAEK